MLIYGGEGDSALFDEVRPPDLSGGPVAVDIMVYRVEVGRGRAQLMWKFFGGEGFEVTVLRCDESKGWEPLADAKSRADGLILYEDLDPLVDGRYGHRLGMQDERCVGPSTCEARTSVVSQQQLEKVWRSFLGWIPPLRSRQRVWSSCCTV